MLEARPLAYTENMPTRNTRKIYGAEQYYHVYTRGINKSTVFHDKKDYEFFLSLFKRYLSDKPSLSKARVPYSWYGLRISLVAYCLMTNHVHMLIYQKDSKAMAELMHSIMTSYSMYYNKKYKHYGPVFQSRYLASQIDEDNYLEHISRYIHLNPKDWQNYKYSSIDYYTSGKHAEWLKPKPITQIFNGREEYINFLKDYEEQKQLMDELKLELAHI